MHAPTRVSEGRVGGACETTMQAWAREMGAGRLASARGVYNAHMHMHTHTHTRTHAHTHTHTDAQTRTHARARAHEHTRTRAHAHTRIRACTCGRGLHLRFSAGKVRTLAVAPSGAPLALHKDPGVLGWRRPG